ncbi:excisionase family DNA binding protein [Nonomuraea thailandensis]|uniref:Excisionase family DNA binding protein n=1 Tax=Nonomuraea thailandensis TaxID=1188745 RepID=A0A9X2K7N9_9ACTN|nr:helix-turn-helix domain-containing protein [Nonomuraea thailandensis]MCP2363368.1 excisionase family DNA binding protein [Nonomuraea thailandensis]
MTVTAPDSVRLDTIDIATQEDLPLLLTVEEAAHRLRIGRTQMYQLVKTGEVASVCIGRLRRVPIECLAAYVNNLLEGSR